jgi:hypothetical protein
MSQAAFCPKCLTPAGFVGGTCERCGVSFVAMFDAAGALSTEFLAARGSCCDSGCRNCPYPEDSADAPVQKQCESCGATFSCGGTGCWCSQLQVSSTILAQLRATYRDCLCEECLTRLAVGQ